MELKGYIQKVEEDFNQLRRQIEKEEEYLRELQICNEDATLIIELINDTLKRERSRLDHLGKVLEKARDDFSEKKEKVAIMKQQLKDKDFSY